MVFVRSVTPIYGSFVRTAARLSFIMFANRNLQRLAGLGASSEDLAAAAEALDTDSLTLGFARRFATYKRPNLLLRDPQRLLKILTNRQHPVQLVLAGKAHPQDVEGQEMIRQWIEFARSPGSARRA